MSEAERVAAWKRENRGKAAEQLRRRCARRREMLARMKLERGCIDCGYKANADALQWDHVRGVKLFNIGGTGPERMSLATLMAEVAKCEVRCGNCHLIKSANERRES